jgi:hypothetical protein
VGTQTITASWASPTDKKTATAVLHINVLPPPPPPWESSVTWDPGASTTSCNGQHMAPPPVPCTNGMCRHGFSCVNDVCQLNGGGGGLQYTLRFLGEGVDMDLHVVEPDGKDPVTMMRTDCEIFYGNRNTGGSGSCGGVGSLDLDSNPSCALDNVDVENIIFPAVAAKPASGTYVARVDLYASCSVMVPITYELEVRAGAAHRYYCGTFMPGDADQGGHGSGRTVSTLIIP